MKFLVGLIVTQTIDCTFLLGWSNGRLMLAQRLGRWANINLPLVQRLSLSGLTADYSPSWPPEYSVIDRLLESHLVVSGEITGTFDWEQSPFNSGGWWSELSWNDLLNLEGIIVVLDSFVQIVGKTELQYVLLAGPDGSFGPTVARNSEVI